MATGTSADDLTLPETGEVAVKFVVTDPVGEPTAGASVTFSAGGFRKLGPGGQLTVNGRAIEPKAMQKPGYWYQAKVPKAARYELVFRRGPRTEPETLVVASHPFRPAIPETFSRRQGLEIAYDGPALPASAEIIGLFSSPDQEGPGRWKAVVRGTVAGQVIRFAPGALAGVGLGPARVLVGATIVQGTRADRYASLAVNHQATVQVTD